MSKPVMTKDVIQFSKEQYRLLRDGWKVVGWNDDGRTVKMRKVEVRENE